MASDPRRAMGCDSRRGTLSRRVVGAILLLLTTASLLLGTGCWDRASLPSKFLEHGAVVIVHLGNGQLPGVPLQQPAQIVENVEQIRLFNPRMSVYAVVSAELQLSASTASRLSAARVVLVVTDQLPPTSEHMHWQLHSTVAKRTDRNNFWRYATERFFFLGAVALKYNLSDIIHIEYDNMIYIDLQRILPVMQNLYQIGGVFDNPDRCIPGFMYFRSANDILRLAQFLSNHAKQDLNDMQVIAQYMTQHPDRIAPLPYFDPATYPDKVDKVFATNLDAFGCIFDGAAYGQYLGGVDPRNMPGNTTGYVSEESLIKPDKLMFEWRPVRGLLVPYASGRLLANLHIHSKNLTRFRSDRRSL